MIMSGDQNQFPSTFAPLGDLLKALMFLLNLNDFNSSPSLLDQRFAQQKWATTTWAIWNARNRAYFDKVQTQPQAILDGSIDLPNAYHTLLATQENS